mmetsp:Transcript_15361/g.36825  ORF Transcript_15361/g.36825 Transcript_15361/m.36825 type:complete len:697 (+) Transcript_15361:176-2266(+)|eukprot:CAMPEP_0181096188 /NCGR_PEP_ID=MMETSP1071-20121207/10901_1 /TAXON_ID=35127 /ORGANISM="Thalassiosira sp., Strain NH16" /LENGTH=696 /DNA_ID=CAMNT_0023178583 /DNA_START=90 /DNA_END=2180 /DNA_ORIENTATION=-
MANHNYRIQQQHVAMARKRQKQKRSAAAAAVHKSNNTPEVGNSFKGNGIHVNVRHISTGDEGVLYTHRITERRCRQRKSAMSKLGSIFSRRDRDDNFSVSERSTGSLAYSRRMNSYGRNGTPIIGRTLPSSPNARPLPPPPQSETLRGFRTFYGKHQKQYTIASKEKYRSNLLNWFDRHHMNFVDYFCHASEVDNNVYRPSTLLYRYIDWTFTASFTGVFFSFLFIYMSLMLVFAGLLLIAGSAEPTCIVAGGAPFGEIPHTKFSDAFALSWTTFTTVGYGMTYTSTASDFGNAKPHECTSVVFLCTSEAFLGLLFAGMCAAILFGKVNRIQSHANIIFCNAVCLQYEEIDDEHEEDFLESERSRGPGPSTPASHRGLLTPGLSPIGPIPIPPLDDEESQFNMLPQAQEESKFVDQFNGCPILKFQVVNELANREGGELVDCIMKVVAIKFKGPDGRVTHSQYVRVNLVDFEHPFLSRVWHGVHILDATSPLLTDRARQRIRENNGSWPSTWFDPDIIRSKLEFHDLIVTVAGISNVSAVTVHAYKRYKIGDVLIGYNFAPIVFRDPDTGLLDVDLSMSNDVREQYGIRGEDLSIRRSGSKETAMHKLASTIRIKRSKSGDGLGSVTSHHSVSSKGRPFSIPAASPAGSVVGNLEEAAKEDLAISPVESDMAEPDTSEDDITSNQAVFRETDSIKS